MQTTYTRCSRKYAFGQARVERTTPEPKTALRSVKEVAHKSLTDFMLDLVLQTAEQTWLDRAFSGYLAVTRYCVARSCRVKRSIDAYFQREVTPHELADMDADLQAVEADIAALLSEVTT